MTLPPPATPDPTPEALLRTHPALHEDPRRGLMLEGVALAEIAAQVGTPCWVIGAQTLRQRARALKAAFGDAGLKPSFHFAVKAQDHQATLTLLRQEGFGGDVVSGGELQRCLRAGMDPQALVYSGVGKTDDELRLALRAGIGQINVESPEELVRLNALALELGLRAPVALRVNPDVDAGTHDKITTGRAEDKFGIAAPEIIALYRQACETMPGIEMRGLAVHLGSQILTEPPYRQGYQRLAELVTQLRTEGLAVHTLDCGGGLGIAYRDEQAPEPAMLARVIADILGPLEVELKIEPGRWLVGPAGVLVSRVIGTRAASEAAQALGSPDFVILDAGMNDLLRPALYEAWHGILPVAPASGTESDWREVDVVGPICESSDVFARNRRLPPLEQGDLVALLDAGAYGSVMSSTYNTRPFCAQVMVDGDQWRVIRPRQTLEELLAVESVPEWLAEQA
ncbi:diaminopimelate decarboxylase [Oecophyllibacter saccharovorans]|uniref:diaminopimelate decarboxylase n=1 Tax=Oecophyllibacter saccharovorans TaxID=2558360 RepID=UPI00116678C1|nr:diaminopimelate decarboxylase [Oecophyllibacter saccharovorans]TPW36753.1 diaminopimelate decarboxylase [Oecophyllibacter saccharovorans]